MDERDSLRVIMETIDAFTKERDWEQFHSVKNLMASVSIEASELNETIQWSNPSIDAILQDSSTAERITDEVADVLIYCLRICSVLNIDPIGAMHDKIGKNRLKYPVEEAKGNSLKYTSFGK